MGPMGQTTRFKRDTVVAGYVLEDCVGSGAFGEVWSARADLTKAEHVAIKLPLEEEYVQYLKAEGQIVSRGRTCTKCAAPRSETRQRAACHREWCQDWFERYSAAAQIDPTGPDEPPDCGHKVLRGGNWFWDASLCRSACRTDEPTTADNGPYGLRIVLAAAG